MWYCGPACFAVLVELFFMLITRAVDAAERCYDCNSRHHKGCADFSGGSAFVKDCDATAMLDPEEDRCIKMHKLGSDVVMRSCVKQGSPGAAIDNGRCTLDEEKSVITCVCSGYLCNHVAPSTSVPYNWPFPVLLLGPFFLWFAHG